MVSFNNLWAVSRLVNLLGLLLVVASVSSELHAAEDTISNIEIRNVKRISTDLVFVNLPLRIGDKFSKENIANAVKSLYRSGYFDDILISREGDVLIIEIAERPTIRELSIKGNELVKEKDLLSTLERNGISVGQILRRDTLDQIVRELEQVYGNQGRYGTIIDVETVEKSDLLVNLSINISEAAPALIASINIIGNQQFDDDELIESFESNQRDFWTVAFSWAYDANSYTQSRIAGDLERLRDYYFERGYVDFIIRSTDVTISNDYRNVYISITVEEGNQYMVGEVDFVGELIGERENYTNKITLQAGDTYLTSKATAIELEVKTMLEDLGYGFAEVKLQLKPKRATRTVDLVYLVKPGKRLYIRRITFAGNTSTTESTMRRELRIYEGGWFSNAKIIESENRLRRLGFFGLVSHKIVNVLGRNDQVDIEFSVEDIPTGSFSGALTYSNLYGGGISFKISEKNIAGTGNAGSINLQLSERINQINFDLIQPYTNVDGASLSTNFSYYKVNYKGSDIANYASSSYSAGASIGYPLGDNWRFNYGGSLSLREIILGEKPIVEITNFTEKYTKNITIPAVNLSLSKNNYDTGFMPTRGLLQRYSLYSTVGYDKLHFYRLGYNFSYYQPLDSRRRWVYRPTLRLGRGATWDTNKTYPFLFNYFAGGYGTVRGYTAGSLGPSATTQDGTESGSIGGNILLQSSQELIFPIWYHTERTRFLFFYDIGNVFTEECQVKDVDWCTEGVDTSKLRQSAGITVEWYTVIGPLAFIFPKAINPESGDSISNFEFSLGRVF